MSNFRFTSLLLVILLALAIALPAHADDLTTQARANIERVLKTQQDAWNRHDLESFMAGYWNSPDLTFFSGGQ